MSVFAQYHTIVTVCTDTTVGYCKTCDELDMDFTIAYGVEEDEPFSATYVESTCQRCGVSELRVLDE